MGSSEAHDLTQTVGGFLDRHMMLPMLDFLGSKQVYPESELDDARLKILSRTNMVDFAMDIHKKVNPNEPVPAEMSTQREAVMAKMQTLRDEAAPLLDILSNGSLVSSMRSERCFNLAYLQEHHNITLEHVAALGKHAKFTFDCGDYRSATSLLSSFRLLTPNADDAFSAQWGRLACEILLGARPTTAAAAFRPRSTHLAKPAHLSFWLTLLAQPAAQHTRPTAATGAWDAALEELGSLRDAIEARSATTSAVMQLQQRAWLMHWALFLLPNHASGRQVVSDLFLSERYLNTIQTTCPHLLRYLAVAIVTTPRRRHLVKELVRVIAMEKPVFLDPITAFLDDLYNSADFEQAQEGLVACATTIENDFFLRNASADFLSHARLHIFESYCRIHERIDLESLAQKLGMERLAAEKWIVKMVSDAQLNARIDEQSGHVLLGVQPPDVYQQVIEKTKGLSFRSYVLAQNLQQKEQAMAGRTAA